MKMPNLELTPPEFLRLVQALKLVPDATLIANDNNELTFFMNDPHTHTLVKKLGDFSEIPEIAEYLDKTHS
jgi:hypothetical protein